MKSPPKMNLLAVVFWCVSFTYAAGNSRSISDIRLVNGTGPYGGRVEIQMNGIWGTVCDDSFDFNDATVMCRMMNLKASTYLTAARYGQGTGPTFTQFQCKGHELHFKDCPFVSNVHCTHARDIGIICSECSDISISNEYGVVDISSDGTVLSAMCEHDVSSNATSTCNNGTWSPPSIICKHDIIKIRLANGTGLYDGRIELLVNGTWGTVCSTSFSSKEAKLICRTLFGTDKYRQFYTSSSYYGPGIGPVHIDNLGCTGSERDINECSYSLDVSCTDHSRDASVACNVQHLNIKATRLVNGTGPYDGRVELYVDGYWGTICNRFIDKSDALTICSTLNASLTLHFAKSIYGKGTGPVLIDSISCYLHRDHVNECLFYSPYGRYCAHEYDLSIVCTPCGLPKIHNGEAFSFNNTELTVKCQQGFFPDYIKMRCIDNETWVEIQRCTSYDDYPLDISEMRLNNSNHFPHEGRIELLVNGTWGTVCDTDFDEKDAAVLCRMLDLEYKRFYINAGHFGKGSGAIFVDNLHCNGTEKHINNCTYNISNYCTHDDDVGVVCRGYQLNITEFRLAGTNGPYHGRVEIKLNGTWGTVCGKSLSYSEASVFCHMLGLTYKYHYNNATYRPGSGPIYRLHCPYLATQIKECEYDVDNLHNSHCDHGYDVSVVCHGPRLSITDARLVNGTGPYDGRAEIKVNGTWGTICDEHFDILNADYFCKMLGLRAVIFYTGAFYGKGSGPVFIDQLLCSKYNSDLSACSYLFLNECTHGRDVAVVCNECGQAEISHWDTRYLTYNGTTLYADCSHYKTLLGTLKLTCNSVTQTWQTEGECQEYNYPLNITDIRLADGPGPSQGRVEIKSLNTWGTICGDNFGISEANLICRMVGYTRALNFLTGAFYGEGKGPIYADDLDCKDNAFDLNDCSYKTYDDCTHGDDIAVVCTDCGITVIATWGAEYLTYNGTTMYADCDYKRTYLGTLKLTCNGDNKSWVTEGECQKYSYPLNVTDIRLVDGPSPLLGRVEIKYLNTWGTICDDGFNMLEADVICRMVGYTYALKFYGNAFYGRGKGPIFVDGLDCNENAFDLNDCAYKTNDDCSHQEDISVMCLGINTGCRDATPRNGFVNTSSTSFLTTVYVTCENGFKLIGEEIIICQPNGTWSNQPVCKLIDCGDPTPVHGSSNSSVTINGTAVLITCQTGYTLIGESIIICQPDDTWTSTPSCVVTDCGDATPKHGFVNSSSTAHQSVLHVTCDKSYRLIGDEYIICQSNATWSNRPLCKLIDCGDSAPVHGSSNSSVSTSGTVARIECQTGYSIIGDSIITCQENEAWTGAPSCVIKDCGDITPTHGFVNTSSTTYLTAVHVTCEKEYILIGEATSICQDNALWSNRPFCKLIDCGDATPKNGSVNPLSTTYQSVVHVTCDKSYKLIGKEYIVCLPNSTWSNRPFCKLIDCGDPSPVHGSSNSSFSTIGTVALIECETEYTLIGEPIVTCQQDETWTGYPSCVIQEKAVEVDVKVISILAVYTGISLIAIIGLVAVIAFRKRNSNETTTTDQTDTVAAGNKAETVHINDDPTNIQHSCTERGSEQACAERYREQASIEMGSEQACTDRDNVRASTERGNVQACTERVSEQASTERESEEAGTERISEQASTKRVSEQASNEKGSGHPSTERESEQASTERESEQASTERISKQASTERGCEQASTGKGSEQACTERFSKTNPYTSIRNVDDFPIGMIQLDNNMSTSEEDNDQEFRNQTMNTKETHFIENVPPQ